MSRMIPKWVLCWGMLRHRMREKDSNEWFWTTLTASSKAVDFLRSTWCRPVVLEVTSLKFDNCWQCVASWQMQKASRIISFFLCQHVPAVESNLVPLQWCKWCITVSFTDQCDDQCMFWCRVDSSSLWGQLIDVARQQLPAESAEWLHGFYGFELFPLNSMRRSQALPVLPANANSTGSFLKVAWETSKQHERCLQSSSTSRNFLLTWFQVSFIYNMI